MVVVELHGSALITAILGPVVGICPRRSGSDEETGSGNLAIVVGNRMVTMMVHGQPADNRIEIIGESDVRCLPGRSANQKAGVSASIGPHISALPIQYLHARLIDADWHVGSSGRGREVQRM